MSSFDRFKRDPNGFRTLVELWEITPKDRRTKMIEVGMAEDPVYAQEALKYMMSFQDILDLPDLELAEVIAAAHPRMVALAVAPLAENIRQRFLKNSKGSVVSEIRDQAGVETPLREVGGAQLKLVLAARELERKGLISAKKIPVGQPKQG